MDTNLKNIKGVIFDYGGTIDTNSVHWAEVLWSAYEKSEVPVTKEQFREAYVYGERTLAKFPLVKPCDNFLQVLRIKLHVEIARLVELKYLNADAAQQNVYAENIANICYNHVLDVLKVTRSVVDKLSKKYKLVLVSNFYGNVETVLKDFCLYDYFTEIVESSVVGVRKPDPAIYQLGVDAMGFAANEIMVIGDSYGKDMVPAKKVGCITTWLSGPAWAPEEIDEANIDITIHSLDEILEYML